MKSRASDLRINLKELPSEGLDLEFSDSTGELTEALKDLIGSNPYRMHVKITPQGNTFDLRGELTAAMNLECSLCASSYRQPINLKLHELILIEDPYHKGDQGAKTNHAHEWQSEGPDYIILKTDLFDVGEYAHEAVALAEPIRPLCAPELTEGCAHPEAKVQREWLSYGSEETEPGSIRANPFQVLEKMKLKS